MNPANSPKSSNKFIAFLIFAINVLAAGFLAIVIKEKDCEKNIADTYEENIQVNPINSQVLDAQNKIVVDRENKLRDLNSAPKELKQVNTTTTTTTTTTTDSQTKTS